MSTQESEDDRGEPVATRIELSFPADIGTHGRKRIRSDYYMTYLKKVHDSAEVGDEWDEFTDVGCCGSQMDMPLVVEAVEGGSRIDADTEIEYTEREACGVNQGWSVQHDEPEALD
ncbi:hypothetical protein ACFQMA_14515 [Halosimplex aquaticum]|uniref:DUF7968 domain-containing protein n=1 Tax=Halosimplex aquaticum TaxID=3026162 RepID=A0ABD5Y5M1_9EURY|nr:hypothetical protein [Halosimplex aquaticum]